jgi:hypothetical protein
MAGYFSTGQSPQRAVVLMGEEEEKEEDIKMLGDMKRQGTHIHTHTY